MLRTLSRFVAYYVLLCCVDGRVEQTKETAGQCGSNRLCEILV